MPERSFKEPQMDADDLDIFKTFGSVESWRRTVLPLAAPVHHPSGPPPAPTGSLSTSPQAATVPEATFLAVPPVGRTSFSARNAVAPPSSQEASASTNPYPASDPLGFFVKRPVKARSVAPERTLSLSSCGSANPINLTRTPSLSEASSYAGDHLQPHKGTTASSDCPSSPPFLPMAADLGPSLSLSAGPSPLSSPAVLRPEEDLVHPPPVSLLSALLASHSHHTKALTHAQNVNSNHSSALPSSFASPASSMPNSTASSPLGGVIHPHLAQTARQRRFSSGAGDVLENVGEDVEAEELESNGQDEPPSVPPLPAQQPRLTFLTELQQRPQLTSKARIGIPSAKPPSIFLASSPAPSIAPSAAASVRKSSIVFIDDPEIAARRGVVDPASAASSAPPSEPATDASSSQLQTSTPELSPAPSTRAPLNPAPHPMPAVVGGSSVPPPQAPTPRRGLSFMLPSADHARQAPPSSSFTTIATIPSQLTDRPPTPPPVKKASGLTFAVATVCARPKALGPEKSVGALEDDDDEEDDDDDEGQGASDEEEDNDEGDDDDDDDDDGDDDDEDDEEESEGEGKGLDVLAEEDDDDEQGYEEDDEGEGSDGYNVGERDGERYRFRRTDLFGHDSDDDGSTCGASDSDQAFDETASIRTKTSGRGSIFSNFSGLAPLDGGTFGEGEEGGEDMSSTYRPGSLQHRRSSSLRNRGSWHRHSPSLPPIQAADPADLLALEEQTPTTQSTSSSAPAPPPRRRPLFSFIRGRRGGAAPRSPHHAPRLLSNGVAAFSPGLPRMQEGLAHPLLEPEPEPICRDDFLPTHLKSERGKEKQREAELRELMSSTDGGGGGASGGVGRNGKCSRHRSPPPSSSGRDRSQDASRIKSRTKRGTKPAKYTALDDLSGTLRPKPSVQLHASDSGIRTTPPVTRKTTRRRSDNHGTLRPRLAGQTAATAVFLSEADVLAPPIVRIRSRPIPTPRPRSWDGDDGGFD